MLWLVGSHKLPTIFEPYSYGTFLIQFDSVIQVAILQQASMCVGFACT